MLLRDIGWRGCGVDVNLRVPKAGQGRGGTKRFGSATYGTAAAVHGEGVLLGRSTLVSADLAAARPVRPFRLELKASANCDVVYLEGALRQRKVHSFRDWLEG